MTSMLLPASGDGPGHKTAHPTSVHLVRDRPKLQFDCMVNSTLILLRKRHSPMLDPIELGDIIFIVTSIGHRSAESPRD